MIFWRLVIVLTLTLGFATGDPTDFVEDVAFIKIGEYKDPQGSYEKVYYLSRHFQALWTNTRSACVAYGMDVLSLETLDEANHFLALCRQKAGFFDQWTHIGGITLEAKSTNFWYWVNSGKRITYYMDFLPGQPDNMGGRELCLSIGKDLSGFRFNDLNCYGSHEKFVCQKSLVNIVF